MHLYYIDVLRALLTHSHDYAGYFAIRALLTPYSLHYYSLLAMERVFSPVTSEKILICMYIVLFGWAFKYLVESVARPGGAWALLGLPFCLHRLVYMGFFNYCFGVALTLLLAGYWIRWHSRLDGRRIALLGGGFVLLLLTHPIPVAVLLLLFGLVLAMELLQDRIEGQAWSAILRGHLREMAVVCGMALTAGLWVLRFVEKPHGPELDTEAGTSIPHWMNLELKLWPVVPITSHAYRGVLIVFVFVVAVTLILAVARKRGRVLSPRVAALLVTSVACFLLFAFVPEWINGGAFFRERFPIFFVLLLLACAAAAAPSVRWSYVPGIFALVALASTLMLQWQRTSQIAAQLRPLLAADSSLPRSGSGLILADRGPLDPDLSFDPYFWAAAHYFRQSHAILLNAPWLDLPINILRLSHPDPWNYLDPYPETKYVSSQSGCRVPHVDFAIWVGTKAASGRIDSVIRSYCLSPSARAGERLLIYRKNGGMPGCCYNWQTAATGF
jgi:hypothetical protein